MKLQLRVLVMVLVGASSATLLCAQEDTKPKSRSIATPSASSVEQITTRLNGNGNPSGGAPSQLTEIVKMSEAGVDEKSILAYVDTLPQARVKADDIIYLHEKGVSPTIINGWLQHANAPAVAAAPAPAQQSIAQAAPAQTQAAQPAASTPVYVSQPAPTYVEPTPVYYTAPSYYPYYYGGYYGWPYFSIGFGGCYPYRYYGGHYYGGHYGGHYYGGGLHVAHYGGGGHVAYHGGGGGLHHR